MTPSFLFCTILALFTTVFTICLCERYEPTWESLDARPLPQWYDNAKLGIFIHFGVFAVPGFVSEWFWCYWKCPDRIRPDVLEFMKRNYPPGFTYQEFAKDFTLEFFNATEWADLFERSGAKYAVLTTKHHEGFTLWPSKHSFSWNAMDVGPHRDVVGEFVSAIRQSPSSRQMQVGLYHSLFEWFNPLYETDRNNNFTTRNYAQTKGTAELYELVDKYRPNLIWSDGDAGPVDYWKSKEFLAWLYNDSPVAEHVVVNDRWGDGTSCKHGGYYNCADRYTPSSKQSHKWENAMTLDRQSWGNRRDANVEDFLTPKELIVTLAQTVAMGGNLLVNVGPTKEGKIPPIMQERLLQLGEWMDTNGEAIYDTMAWSHFNDTITPEVYYTVKYDGFYPIPTLYAIFFEWPANGVIELGCPHPIAVTPIRLLGYKESLHFETGGHDWGVRITLPNMALVQNLQYGWVLKMTPYQTPEINVLN